MPEGGEVNYQIKDSANKFKNDSKSVRYEGGDENEDDDSSIEKDDNWVGESDDTEGKSEHSDLDDNEKSLAIENDVEITETKHKPNFSLLFYNIDNSKMIEKFKKYDITGSIIELT